MGRLFDNHNHSQFSFDGGNTSVERSVRSAMSRGLCGMCFTDHCDFYVPPMKAAHENLVPEEFDIAAQQEEIDRVRIETSGQDFRIFKGIEIGLGKKNRGKIEELLRTASFDQIIASLHYLEDTDPFYGGYYEGKDWRTAYGLYLETLYEEMVWMKDFDIMGHFDYVARYAPYPECSVLYRDFPDQFDAILKFLAENGKVPEVNTKTYKEYKGRKPELDPDILKRFMEYGGEAVSLGSDSHNPERVGDNFRYFEEYLEHCGFRYTAHYENRRPVLERI